MLKGVIPRTDGQDIRYRSHVDLTPVQDLRDCL